MEDGGDDIDSVVDKRGLLIINMDNIVSIMVNSIDFRINFIGLSVVIYILWFEIIY